MLNEDQDLLRAHWHDRRDSILRELRGMEVALKVVPGSPAGQEVRTIVQDKADGLRVQLRKLEGYLGLKDTTP